MKQVFDDDTLHDIMLDALREFNTYAMDETNAIKFAIKFIRKVMFEGYTVMRIGDDHRAYNVTVKFSVQSLKHYMGSDGWNDVKRRAKATMFATAITIAIIIASEGLIMCNPYPIKSLALFGAMGTGFVCGSMAYDYVYKMLYPEKMNTKEVYGYDKRTEQVG